MASTSGNYLRISLEKCQFWHGIMTINETNITSFFLVNIKTDVPDTNNVGICTDDLPAFPISVNDTIRVVFNLEMNIGTNPTINKVCETTFHGSDLWNKVSEVPPTQQSITIVNDVGEWTFSKQETFWIIRSFLVYCPLSQLRKYVKDA